jgi:hypothetical protein
VRLLLVVIDAATPHVVCPAVRTGRLPVLRALADAGDMHESSVSIFPSITPAATTSIITGAYPAEHGIAGASWYDRQRGEVAYYGDDFWVIAREGFGEFVKDFLLRLNGDRLLAPTLFEMIERAGRSAASLNYLVFRGTHPHHADIPKLMAALPGVPLKETVEGPSTLCLGDFVSASHGPRRAPRAGGGPFRRFGMDDESSGELLCELFARGPLPDFTVAYFADNDYRSHEVGPVEALPVIERVDAMLGQAFDAAGGLDRVLSETVVIVTSDHGHCDVRNDPEAEVRLDRLLADFRQAKLGERWRTRDEIMICPNMRAAQIYLRHATPDLAQHVIHALLGEPRVDQVIWRSALTRAGQDGYRVASARGVLEFSEDATAGNGGVDAFGTTWSWRGDAEALDLRTGGRAIEFGQYPNAFERIAGALDLDESGELWVTAHPGCEFAAPGGAAHIGGASHGALHALDSLCPVIIAGGHARRRLPAHMRSVDIASLCMDILRVPMRYRIGDARNPSSLIPHPQSRIPDPQS